ncbi:MAG: IPT/TIG domain-containing protein [Tannerella sp.]|jgi:streptogramin lyase|nr:IPT/TIG domain-containing protein [Tannerella sp.]
MYKSMIKYASVLLLAGLAFACGDEEKLPSMSISDGDLNPVFGHEASSRRISVATDGDFSVISSEAWCTVEKEEDDRSGFTLSVEENPEPDARTADVLIAHQGLSNRKIIVRQQGAGGVITADEALEGVTVESGQPLEFTLTVQANVPIAFELPDWIHEGANNQPVTGEKTYFFTLDPLDTAGERTGSIRILSQDETYPAALDIPVVQRHASHTLASFSPATGALGTEITLTGSHFGEVLSSVKVYFDRQLAEITSLFDHEIKVTVPPCRGNLVYSISVVIGKDSLVYPDVFTHIPTTLLKTLTGDGTQAFRAGTLATAQIRARYLSIDPSGNLFASMRDNSVNKIIRISEAENSVSALSPDVTANISAVDPVSGTVYIAPDNERAYYTVNPGTWTLTRHSFANVTEAEALMGTSTNNNGWAFSPSDGCLYSRYSGGAVLKLDPRTDLVTKVCDTPAGASRGIAFNPVKPHLLYYVIEPNGIATLDVRDGIYTRLNTSSVTGKVEGAIAGARFSTPYQICFDSEGRLYIADRGNHCIRVVSTDNFVSTLVGTTQGHADGTMDVAKMNTPSGVCIGSDGAVYIAEITGCYIRKYVVE